MYNQLKRIVHKNLYIVYPSDIFPPDLFALSCTHFFLKSYTEEKFCHLLQGALIVKFKIFTFPYRLICANFICLNLKMFS